MSAAFALIMLAEAATACAPAPRFAGGAVIVRPVGRAEPVPLQHLGPATGIAKDKAIEQTGAPMKELEPAQASQPCETVVLHQV
jgi:hypothetical protein